MTKQKRMSNLEARIMKTFYPVGLGSGNLDAKYMFIGINPSIRLKEHGERCLVKRNELIIETSYYFIPLIEKYFGKDGYYNTNLVKVPTEMNLQPSFEMISQHLPYLKEEIDVVHPRLIVALGNWVYNILIKNGIHAVKIYHPAYINRMGTLMLPVFEQQIKDLQNIRFVI